jgi:hypothetical protein
VPALLARPHHVQFPIEIELVLLVIVLADTTIGRSIGGDLGSALL